MPRVAAVGRVPATNLQNYLLRSSELDNASWTKTDCSFTPNAAIAPDGTLTADKFVENALNAEHVAFQTANAAGWGDVVSVSACFKRDGSGRNVVFGLGFSATPIICYSPDARQILARFQGGGAIILRADVEPHPDDPSWDIVTLAARFPLSIAPVILIESSNGVTSRVAYLGDGASGFYVWGVQATRSDWRGVYAATAGAIVNGGGTRSKPPSESNYVLDNRNMAGANFTSIQTTRTGGQPDPFGGTEATKIDELAAVSAHSVFNGGSLLTFIRPGTWACGSVVLKAAERKFGGVLFDLGAGSVAALWDLTTGARTSTAFGGAGVAFDAASVVAPAAESLGGGWWRVHIAFFALRDLLTGVFAQTILSSDGLLYGYLGVAGQGLYAFAPAVSGDNRPGPITNTTSPLLTRPWAMRNRAIGRVVP